MKPLKVEHIGIAVSSIEQALNFYRDTLGLELQEIEVKEEYSARLALLKVGETLIELIESTSPEGNMAKFIRENGEGLHHICFEVRDIKAALAQLRGRGVSLLDNEPKPGHQGSQIAFIDPVGSNGVLVELCQPGPPSDKSH